MKYISLIILLLIQSAFSEELIVATFNTGLRKKDTHQRDIRYREFLRELRRSDAEIICLQELVHKKEREKVLKELGFRYKYHHFSSQTQAYYRWPVCSLKEIFDIEGPLACRYKNCLKMRGDTMGKCLDDKCAISFERLRLKNPNCSQAQLSQQNTNIIMAFVNLLNPFKKVKRFSGPGKDGLLLLSKRQLLNKDEVNYQEISTHRRRGAISAEVVFNEKPLKIICAHLTSNLDGIYPYPGVFNSWEEENRAQVEKVVLNLDPDKKTLIMGGLGCSRSVKLRDVQDNFEGNCAPLFGKGLTEPFYNMNPECTFCPYNNLVTNKIAGGLILDNILTSGVEVKEMNLIFNNAIDINPGSDDLELTYISDHFGLRAILKGN
jgi:endonuclease/exonuclease/phosphatase family metal-dependent hydrolase